MAAPQASSRLEMLQARFQQKQLQEKEQKLLQLYDQQQQRAYQVVQRGSAGSNSSNHGSTIRTTSTHTTSTSQGGKVRQMFDERRQTTVKGIDRSYPLEPLENKLRKQAANTNGLTTQRNGNLTTVNRQSVNVKRVARADVNSNVNGGKPVVSYREEVTRESFGPSVHRHDDEDEFENRVVNGHHRHDLDNEEETFDQETIDRNRMMAKIHLMGFDESLKHRVRNDLESEEFPEYLTVDVPDKLPKRSVTKKLSQAEARLERFKNANAKRSNNNASKQSTTIGAATKRRTEQMLPVRSNSKGSEIADGTSSGSARSGSSRAWERGRGNPEKVRVLSPRIHAVDRPYIADDEVSKTRRLSPDVETFRWSDSPRSSPRSFSTTEATWRSYSPDNYYKSLSSDGKIIMRRGASPRFRKSMDFRSASADRETRETRASREKRASRSTSPEFFCREGERSATTMMIDRRGSASSHEREILTQQNRGIEETAMNIDRKYAAITRSQSPRFFRKEFERPGATMSLDRTNMDFRSASADRQTPETRASRSTSPEFFYREGERSARTMMINERARRPTVASRTREMLTKRNRRIKEAASLDRKYDEIMRERRSSSPPFFLRDSAKSGATMSVDRKGLGLRSISADRQTRETRTSRSTTPEFYCKEGERSATTMMIDRRGSTSSRDREILTQQSKQTKGATTSIDRKYAEITRKKRTSSPSFFLRDSGKSATMNIDRKNISYRSASADRQTRETRTSRSTRPEFYCKEGERSATTMMIDRRGSTSRDREISTQQSKQTKRPATSIDRKYAEIVREKRSVSPSFFLRDFGKSGATKSVERTGVNLKSMSADRRTRETRTSRSTSPEFYCKEGERSATTMMIDRRGSTSSRDREILTQHRKRTEGTSTSIDRKYAEVTRDKRSSTPFFLRDSGKSGTTTSIDRKNTDHKYNYRSASADRQTRETRTSRSTSPEFFCKEGERSATTMMIDRRGSTSSRDREMLTKQSKRTGETSSSIDRKYAEVTRDKRSSDPQFFCKESKKSATTMLIEPKSSLVDTTKSILKRRKYTSDTSYKQRPSSSNNKGGRFTRVRHTPSPPMSKNRTKKNSKKDVSSAIVRLDSRRSSKISDISANSASSMVSLKYGLEFDDILQSTGLVRKFMKSQKGEAHYRSPLKRDIKNVSARNARNGQPRNRYKVSPLFQKSRSPSADSKERTTPEYSRKSITPTEFDVEIQEITMTDHRYKSRKSSSPEQPKSRVDSPDVSNSLRKIILPKKDCGRQHGVKSKAPPRFLSLGKTTRRAADIPKITFPRKVAVQREEQDYASKYATYTIKGRKRQNALLARKGSPDLSDGKINVESKSEESKDARGLSKATLTQLEDRQGIGRMQLLSVQESATRASPEISLRTMDMQTKAPAEKLDARSTVDSSREVTSDMTSRSTLRTSIDKSSRVAYKDELKKIPSKVIRSSKRITKTYRSSIENKPRSTQRTLPTCKRQLFESDSEKEVQKRKEKTSWSSAKTQKKENYSSANVRLSRRDEATSKVKPLDVAKRSRSLDEASTISVKPLRSIEDIRKSIGCDELTAATRSRSAIANWRSSTSRESGDARRSSSARLTKVQSCVSRIAKSPSPDASARKQHETNARATRGSTPSSPSKSPDMNVAPRRGSTEPKNQDARSASRPIVAKAAESIGNKTTSEAMDAVDGVVPQNSSPYESSAKKSDAFVIDLDDRPKESDTTPPKKATPMRRSSNDKNQTTSSATGRPVSSNSSSAGTTQSQASSTKGRMATRAKTSVSGVPQAKGPSSARNVGNTNSADNLIACNTCGRNFAQDRIRLHEQICAKTMNKKRKKFDAMTFRVKGTELEPFVKKGVAKKQESHAKKPELKSNWRRKHEEFIETIRSAKMVQSHLAAGGNLKDLPPPPPSDTSDYIQCPHCGRRFNQAAAERHIPKCEHMLHNKPAHTRAAAKSRR